MENILLTIENEEIYFSNLFELETNKDQSSPFLPYSAFSL